MVFLKCKVLALNNDRVVCTELSLLLIKIINSGKIFIFFFFFEFLAALCLCCCAWAFSSCGERGLLFVAVHRLLIAVASLVAEHGL